MVPFLLFYSAETLGAFVFDAGHGARKRKNRKRLAVTVVIGMSTA